MVGINSVVGHSKERHNKLSPVTALLDDTFTLKGNN